MGLEPGVLRGVFPQASWHGWKIYNYKIYNREFWNHTECCDVPAAGMLHTVTFVVCHRCFFRIWRITISRLETSITNYQQTLHNSPANRRSRLLIYYASTTPLSLRSTMTEGICSSDPWSVVLAHYVRMSSFFEVRCIYWLVSCFGVVVLLTYFILIQDKLTKNCKYFTSLSCYK
jgi:hypothetical protein